MKSALQTLIERGSPDEILENCGEYDLQTLIVPAGHKPLFKACAKILAELPDETFEPLAAESARWLQDLNWPGCGAIQSKAACAAFRKRSCAPHSKQREQPPKRNATKNGSST